MKNLLISLFFLSSMTLSGQETIDFLFIGDSFFAYNELVGKFRKNYFEINKIDPVIDSSLLNGVNAIRQIQAKDTLRTRLQEKKYRTVILQSPSLLEFGIDNKVSDGIKELLRLCPSIEKVILITLNECTVLPKYECASVGGTIECNIFNTCQEEHDTVKVVTERLSKHIEKLEILPFSLLKKEIIDIPFTRKEDVYGHPSSEMQELLARCIVIWLSGIESESATDIFTNQVSDKYLSLTKEEIENIVTIFINIISS